MERLKRIWADPVWSKVIAGVILASLGALWISLEGGWHVVRAAVRVTWEFTIASTLTPNWMLGLLAIIAVIGMSTVVIALLGSRRKLDWRKDYVSDTFFGVRWMWKYSETTLFIEESDLRCFCTNCGIQILPSAYSSQATMFECDNCHDIVAPFNEPVAGLRGKVLRLIQMKIGTGEWQTALDTWMPQRMRKC